MRYLWIPDGFETRNPTLRQAMLLGMRARPRSDWSVTELHDMPVMHVWIDPDAKDQGKRISDMAAVMISDKVLERAGRGVDRLPESLAAALERRLHPITDYELSGKLGFPVPSRPAPRGAHKSFLRIQLGLQKPMPGNERQAGEFGLLGPPGLPMILRSGPHFAAAERWVRYRK